MQMTSGASGHKKSNSLMNSKMAQILLKNPNPSQQHQQLINNSQIHFANNTQTRHQMPQNQSNLIGHINANQLIGGVTQSNPIYQQQQQQHGIQNPSISASQKPSYSLQQQTPHMAHNQQMSNHPQIGNHNLVNNTAMNILQQQSSFEQNHMQNSIDYNKKIGIGSNAFYDNYEEMSRQQQHQLVINQAPSNKQIIHSSIKSQVQQPINLDSMIHHQMIINHQTLDAASSQKKTQNSKAQSINTSQIHNQQQIPKQIEKSAQKSTKKVGGHQRTKSDQYYNRGSITAKMTPGSAQQNKRVVNNEIVQNQRNFVEVDLQHYQRGNNQASSLQKNIASLNENSAQQSNTRKVPNSAHHSKKPSTAGNINQAQQYTAQNSNSRKSTKEKYNELKAMYDDLLEKHYIQQQQIQSIVPPAKFGQSTSINNLANMYPMGQQSVNNHMQQMMQQHQMMDQSIGPNISANISSTPRLTISNQLSSTGLNNQGNIFYNNQMQGQGPVNQMDLSAKNIIQLQTKQIKHPTNKVDQEALKPKAILKLQLNQGQSRKNAQGHHKRSVSDGNDQLFKFKQQSMQRYLYPQPSNSTLQPVNEVASVVMMQGKTEDMSMQSSRSKVNMNPSQSNLIQSTPYQQSNHQRRVSDDHNNKQKKQLLVQSQVIGHNVSKEQLIQQQHQNFMGMQENVITNDHPSKKLQTTDFNIKSFLIEMRNKQGITNTNSNYSQANGFINIIDEQPESFQKLNLNNNDKQFAMIIEENSPLDDKLIVFNKQQPNNTLGSSALDSSRKMSVMVDSQSQQMLSSQASKPNIEFNKVNQKYKYMRLEDKRSSSPNIEFEKHQNSNSKKQMLAQASHKRVKSDIPVSFHQNPQAQNFQNSSNILSQSNNLYVKHNNPLNIQQSVLQQQKQINKKGQQQQQQQNTMLLNSNPSGSLLGYSISDKNTPKKSHQKMILQQQNYNIFSLKQQQQQQRQQSLEQQAFQHTDSKKVINVSIDLIKDGLMLDASQSQIAVEDSEVQSYDGWQLDNNNNDHIKQENKQKQFPKSVQLFGKQIEQQIKNNQVNFSGGSTNSKNNINFSGPVRHEKYKKMLQKYENTPQDDHSKKLTHQLIPSQPNPYTRKHTFDAGPPSGLNSNSHSPSNIMINNLSPKNKVTMQDKMNNEIYKKQLSSKVLMMPNSPKGVVVKKTQVQNLMQHQPKSKQQQQQQVVQSSHQHQITDRQLLSNRSTLQPPQQAPNNSIVCTQESPRPSLISQSNNQQQQIIHPTAQLVIPAQIQTQQMMSGSNTVKAAGERIETQESDSGLSPRSRGINKLVKHVKLSFKQTQQPPQTSVEFYRIGKVLGKGAFGKVNLALHSLSGKFAAVKSINKQYLSEDSQTKKVMQEVVILKRTRHRNIVRLYEFFETQKHILFVIELCAGGDLLNYVRKRRRLKEDCAKLIFKQLLEALQYCHSKNIVHRDIKLDNILLDSNGEVKICDFGVSKIVKKGEIMMEQCGTPAYIAPEILRDKGYSGFQVDVWSAGVVLYAMLYGTVPFKANNMSELQKLILKAKYTLKEEGVSQEARDLITCLLEKDPAKRLTIEQTLKHCWLQDVDESIQMFTEQERDYIKNEFTYNDTERYNRNEGDDLFTDHMLDSTNNSLLKNQTSKSVILAPFNSTKSDINCLAITESMKKLIQSKGCLKFNARCRDIDKQYEINNNAELDNGVYHKNEEEENKDNNVNNPPGTQNSQDSLQSSFNKQSSLKSEESQEALRIKKNLKKQKRAKKEKQSELEKLESLICQQEEDDKQINDNPYHGGDTNRLNSQLNNQKSPRIVVVQEGGFNGGLETAQTLIIDERVVQSVEHMGYPKEYIIKALNNNDLNYATTGYYLLKNQHALSFIGVTALNITQHIQQLR